MTRPALLLATLLAMLSACSRDDPPPSVANQSAAIANDLEARANALEMQADNMASLEVEDALRNAPDLDAALANMTNEAAPAR
ncbi:hypothetical protein [Sphingomonas sp.]|jgi:hypothetical protein|uniref:hypothetical protein n=1 Tax=Sphingomonas sp. TaxID=28214 RepID=UPI0035C78F3F